MQSTPLQKMKERASPRASPRCQSPADVNRGSQTPARARRLSLPTATTEALDFKALKQQTEFPDQMEWPVSPGIRPILSSNAAVLLEGNNNVVTMEPTMTLTGATRRRTSYGGEDTSGASTPRNKDGVRGRPPRAPRDLRGATTQEYAEALKRQRRRSMRSPSTGGLMVTRSDPIPSFENTPESSPRHHLPERDFSPVRPVDRTDSDKERFKQEEAKIVLEDEAPDYTIQAVQAPPKPTLNPSLAPVPELSDPARAPIPVARPNPTAHTPCSKHAARGASPQAQAQADADASSEEVTQKEGKREREIRERKAYLKDFWYCVGLSEGLKDKPQEVKILGRTVVLFRDIDTGKVMCMESTCPHRGAPLGEGWTKKHDDKTCVVCPYHGWAFDGKGRLSDVPAATRGQLPKHSMLNYYPVEEKGGFIWLFFGSKNLPADERPPIPWVPELDDPNWRAVYAEMEFEAPHWSTFDNALDMAHIHYVHVSSFGNPDKPEILDMSMKKEAFGIEGSFKIHNKPMNSLWEWTRVPHVPVKVKAFLPMSCAVHITLAHGMQMITFVNTVPIDEHRSINRFCLLRNFATSPLLDGAVRQQMYTILSEDKEMVEMVRPDDMPKEYSLEPDLPQIAFRKLRQEFVDMGYSVDPPTTAGRSGSLWV